MELIWNYYTKELGITKYKKKYPKIFQLQVSSCKLQKLQVASCKLFAESYKLRKYKIISR